jgi:desulfoferrodoxin (superoxide reductase-like protein)
MLGVVMALGILAMPALAHAPSDIAVSYDKNAAQLTVTVTHPVDDPTTHYIRNIKVNVNGRVIVDKDYTSQPSKDTFTYTYNVPVGAGDTVRVTAYCVLAGSREAVLTLPTPSSTAPPTISQTTVPQPTTQKSPSGIIPLLGLLACGVLAIARDRKK